MKPNKRGNLYFYFYNKKRKKEHLPGSSSSSQSICPVVVFRWATNMKSVAKPKI